MMSKDATLSNFSVADAEALISPAMMQAGAERLSDIGEASVAYLAKEAFLAMVLAASRENSPLGVALRHESQPLS